MKTNQKANPRKNHTHEGARAFSNLTAEQQLRRSVMSCLLFENEFYEDGQSIADRIVEYAAKVDPEKLAEIAIEARHEYHLRHVPLLLLRVLAKTGAGRKDSLVSATIATVISRADELSEFLALYWKNGKTPLSKQVKKGLALAFRKFDEYQLSKYNRNADIKLRDVLFLVHPKPDGEEKEKLWRRLADNTLKSADTWEVSLSTGKDKGETFTRLLREKKLGYMALLRNLRNMLEAGVDRDLIESALLFGNSERVLPFRFIAAARACPRMEPVIDHALKLKLKDLEGFKGTTIFLVDVSGSMEYSLSARSDMSRMDAAAALASIFPVATKGASSDVRVFTFSEALIEVPRRLGMAGIDVIVNSQKHFGTLLGKSLKEINKLPHDRLIVITDEQSHDTVPDPVAEKAYMVNVASNKNGVGYGKWIHIDGFSENVLKFMHEFER